MKGQGILLLAWRYLAHRRFATLVSVLAISVSLLFVVGVGVLNFAVKKTAVDSSIRYPLVIGPSGASGVQLILSTIFYIDKPSGTLPFSVYKELKEDKRVTGAYPIAVADTFMNIRIIGTNEEFLNNLGVGTRQGSTSLKELSNVVLGAATARRTGLELGDTFHGQHGMVGSMDAHEHKELTYKVTGILNPTGGPEDLAIYTNYESVWFIHKHHKHHHHKHKDQHEQHKAEAEHKDQHDQHHAEAEHKDQHDQHKAEAEHHGHDAKTDKYTLSKERLTAVLVRTSNPAYTGTLEREYSLRDGTVAVDTGRSIREFVGHINKGEVFIEAVTTGMLIIALAMILVTLVMSLNERRRELALLRSLGVGRWTLSMAVMLETLLLTALGAVVGLLFGHGLAFAFKDSLQAIAGVEIEPFLVTSMEGLALLITLAAGQLLALVAMILTYRLNVVEEISRE